MIAGNKQTELGWRQAETGEEWQGSYAWKKSGVKR